MGAFFLGNLKYNLILELIQDGTYPTTMGASGSSNWEPREWYTVKVGLNYVRGVRTILKHRAY